jgi:hypothetical protein
MPFIVAIGLQRVEKSVPPAGFRPTVEPIEYGFPGPELIGQVPPWHSCPAPPQDGLDEVAIVFRPAACRSLRCEHRCDLSPLALIQVTSNHCPRMEHSFDAMDSACSVHSNFRPPQNNTPAPRTAGLLSYVPVPVPVPGFLGEPDN